MKIFSEEMKPEINLMTEFPHSAGTFFLPFVFLWMCLWKCCETFDKLLIA